MPPRWGMQRPLARHECLSGRCLAGPPLQEGTVGCCRAPRDARRRRAGTRSPCCFSLHLCCVSPLHKSPLVNDTCRQKQKAQGGMTDIREGSRMGHGAEGAAAC